VGSELAIRGDLVALTRALASKSILYFLKLKFRILRIVNVKDHACHAGLDPASMNSESWIADQVRNDSFFLFHRWHDCDGR
jgi:hypothetical protein